MQDLTRLQQSKQQGTLTAYDVKIAKYWIRKCQEKPNLTEQETNWLSQLYEISSTLIEDNTPTKKADNTETQAFTQPKSQEPAIGFLIKIDEHSLFKNEPTEAPIKTTPIIHYPIIKDIHDPQFIAPPPPNLEPCEIISQKRNPAQYQLDIYTGAQHIRQGKKRRLSNREIGSRYERYLGYLYERAGWKVDYHGERMGVHDGGIDLICCTLDSEYCHAVQAKHWTSRQIDTQDIRKFLDNFEAKRHQIPHHYPEAVFITNSHFTPEAKAIAEQHGVEILENIAMPQDYPLVKCVHHKNDTKTYFTPPIVPTGKKGNMSSYIRYSPDFSQGDCYVYTCAEAERRGFEWNG
ncbi:restriction endonuclease [Wielerella bovis]|uniref:restriction endonuclease n=1 Tax=Wielerella bovis TaxID=2917790 RepID=UPI0020193F3F|nr:restriction endonuclease [Wielerella bovis]ULJ66652.1 restriction endonuclease [Wielerella bovis]